jgi:hypothetical protein
MARRKNTETKVKPSGAMTDRKRTAVPDRLDLRDRVYLPPVGVVPDLGRDQRTNIPVLDQRQTNACTGFALATVVYHLQREAQADGLSGISIHAVFNGTTL